MKKLTFIIVDLLNIEEIVPLKYPIYFGEQISISDGCHAFTITDRQNLIEEFDFPAKVTPRPCIKHLIFCTTKQWR